MNIPIFVIAINCLLIMLGVSYIKYQNAFNPVSFVIMLEYGVKSIFAYFVFVAILEDEYNLATLDEALILSTSFYIFYVFGFLFFSRGLFLKAFSRIDELFEEGEKATLLKNSMTLVACVFLVFAFICFGGLVASEGGLLWLKSPRDAYGEYRQGVGVFWAGFVNFLSLSFLILIFANRNNTVSKKIGILLLYTFFLYFSGSKQSILSSAICLLFLYVFYSDKVSSLKVYLILVCVGVGFFSLTLLQGSFDGILSSLGYFDYLLQTSRYLEIKDVISQENPYAFFSYFWSFVPRIIYPEKPFEYGPVLISSYLFPGAAEAGYTPAYLEWALVDIQLGVFGVVALGFLKGGLVSSAFTLYRTRKNSLFAFLICCQLGFSAFNLPGYFELPFILIFISVVLVWSLPVLVRENESGKIGQDELSVQDKSALREQGGAIGLT